MRNDDVLSEFLNECEEKLDKLNLELTKLEKDGFDREVLRSVARDVHTVKGSSQLFGFVQIGQVTHAMEECLERLSDSSKEILPDLLQCLYQALDVVSKLFKVVKATKREPPPTEDVKSIVAKLVALAKRGAANAADKVAAKATEVPSVLASPTPAGSSAVPAPPNSGAGKPSGGGPTEDAQADTIRVHVDLLDNLMNLVGELVLIRNQLGQVAKGLDHETMARVSQRLNVVTGELQNDVMKTRMQPIGNVLNKFQRVVRDMAKDLSKRVDLELIGADTELDKTLIEAVRDPLTHIVRNAVDHGIEGPEERKRAGKREGGTLAIRAFHESGQVVVEIKDDGSGLNRERIAAKAVEKGLVAADSISRLTDREVYQFIFLPGFSTAEKVSNLSGRGVGMDVVRTNIERIGGAVDLASIPGQGTTVTLKIPLTLAIIPALIVHAAGERYAIPQVKLVELLRVEAEPARGRGVEVLHGRPVFRLRGNLLPLVSLSEVLKLSPSDQPHSTLGQEAHDLNIAVLSVERQTFGLVIDAIDDSADIVVKPLATFLKDIGAYSGATILGDGSVALTLDIGGLASLAQVKAEASELKEAAEESATARTATRSHADENTEYLLVNVDSRGKYALPLCLVNRLEEFNFSDLRLSGEQRVVKYRDSLLPLISVRRSLGFDIDELSSVLSGKTPTFPVVVVKKGDRHFGLQVSAIIDVILSPAKIDMNIKDREGLIGSLIDGDDVIAMIDVLGVIDRASVGFAPASAKGAASKDGKSERTRQARRQFRILLAEDGAFFRRHVTQILEDAGYVVRAECDGARALSALEAEPGAFAVVVSDIEMPEMTGFEFVQKVRANRAWSTLPMIAVSSRFSSADVQRGIALGFNRYIEKLNPDELLAEVDSVLGLKGEAKHVG